MTLEEYIRDDADRWEAVHARISGLEDAIFALAAALHDGDRKTFTAFMLGLRVGMTAASIRNLHSAHIGAMRGLYRTLREALRWAPDPTPGTSDSGEP